MKPKGVSTQMKALNEYILMDVFTLQLSGICILNFNVGQRNMAVKELIYSFEHFLITRSNLRLYASILYNLTSASICTSAQTFTVTPTQLSAVYCGTPQPYFTHTMVAFG